MFAKFKAWWQDVNPRDQVRLTFAPRTIQINQQSLQICEASEHDVAAMVAIEKMIYGNAPWNRAAFMADLRRHDRLYLVLKDSDNNVLGFIGGAFNMFKQDTHITNFGVQPNYQRKGLGTYLFKALKQVALAKDMQTMSLEVRVSNYQAQQLYRHLGFVDGEIKPRYYYDNHEDALDMVAKLNQPQKD